MAELVILSSASHTSLGDLEVSRSSSQCIRVPRNETNASRITEMGRPQCFNRAEELHGLNSDPQRRPEITTTQIEEDDGELEIDERGYSLTLHHSQRHNSLDSI